MGNGIRSIARPPAHQPTRFIRNGDATIHPMVRGQVGSDTNSHPCRAKTTDRWNDEGNLWPPYRLSRAKDQLQTDLRCLLQSRYLHGIIFSICLWEMNDENNDIHEDILALLVFLCELAIDDVKSRQTRSLLRGSLIRRIFVDQNMENFSTVRHLLSLVHRHITTIIRLSAVLCR